MILQRFQDVDARDKRGHDGSMVGAAGISSDLAVLRRKWQAAVLPGQPLPGYEEVMLGSLGRLADHIALLKVDGDHFELSRTGRFVQDWIGHDRWDVALSELPPDCALALAQVAGNALQNRQPHLAVASCVRQGLVQKYDLLALPTASRWGGTLIGVYVNEQGSRYNLLDSIFAATDDGILSLAAIRDHRQLTCDFHIVHLNQSAARLLQQPAQALLWSRLRSGCHFLSSAEVLGWLQQVVDGGSDAEFEIDCGDRNLSLSATACGDLLSLTISDVTSLKRREASFRLLFDNNPMPMWVIDAGSMAFLKVNDAAIAHYGYSRAAFLGMTVPEIWPDDEREAHLQAVQQAGDNYLTDRNWRHLKADGTEIEIVAFGRRVAFDGQDGFLVAIVDVTERRKAEARIAYMAHHDALTGLPNREFYQQRLPSLLEVRAAESYVAVLNIDLDLFKNVNDAFGHPTGNRLLQMVAERLRQELSAPNLVARLGSDEFVVVLVRVASPKEASDVAAQLIERLSVSYSIDGLEVVIGASIGIAMAPSDGGTADELLRNADMALDRAKDSGGGCHHFFEKEMDRLAQHRRDLEIDLRRAFAKGQFELHYQPLVELAQDRIAGFEALLRWRHPERGMISPADFVPVAEDIGLIVGIGEWVLRQACAEAATWPEHIKVAVNLSPVQFRSRHLVQAVISALAQSGLPASRLELEITETVFLAETEANLATLHQLRDLGVRISMDDFGTGYSSLSYLRSFPFDKIKIDRSFVQDLAHRPDCLAIVRAISGLGRSLNITTTAEGVESAEQLDWLRAEGCNEVQGFLFSPARPAGEIAALLAQFGGQASRAA
jgi:diguanylate cyclase (GGDEF)-like protein/PAS domain S-box-containing protein